MLILDFDLDYVVRPILRFPFVRSGRYEGDDVTVWNSEVFRSFFERRLRLSRGEAVPGVACEHHKEVFSHTERLIAEGHLRPPFHWVHIDAHIDLHGCSDAGSPTSANFLLHLIGKDWIKHLSFVLPDGEAYPPDCVMNWERWRIEFADHGCSTYFHDDTKYRFRRRPDFVFLTRSPSFTPQSADHLFDIAREYIRE